MYFGQRGLRVLYLFHDDITVSLERNNKCIHEHEHEFYYDALVYTFVSNFIIVEFEFLD